MIKFLKSFLKSLIKIVLIFAILIGILLVIMFPKKTPITSQEFVEMMASQNFSVVETSDDLEEYGISLERCFKTHLSSCEMVFYELTDEKDAETLFDLYKEEIESSSGSSGTSESSLGGNYKIYEKRVTHESFYCLSRIENTLLYVEGDADAKKDVYNLIEKMGYVDVKHSNFSYGFDKTKYYD